ncbi:unnamed protein product, partial [Hymenolepis diminuta]
MELLKEYNHKGDTIHSRILLKQTAMIRRRQLSLQKWNLMQSSSILLIENTPENFRVLLVIPTRYKEGSSTARPVKYQSPRAVSCYPNSNKLFYICSLSLQIKT